jgi:guanyl-specific ribonuclease Sa
MGKLSAITPVLLLACLAGCGDRSAVTTDTGTDTAAAPAKAEAAPAAAGEDDNATARYACQADTAVVVLDDGTARVSLPGGERHTLERVADSDPQVYAGDSLYFTIQADSAHLSQQDGARELACTKVN